MSVPKVQHNNYNFKFCIQFIKSLITSIFVNLISMNPSTKIHYKKINSPLVLKQIFREPETFCSES